MQKPSGSGFGSEPPKNWSLAQLPGMRADNLEKLQAVGIETTVQLLQRTRTVNQCQSLAAQLQIREQMVRKWVALADLSRIPAVGYQYCGVLLHAGISSVAQLALTPAHKLHPRLLRFYVATLNRSDLCPKLGQVTQWVEQARCLQA